MPDKKKGIDEIFEEEFFDLPSKKPKKTAPKKEKVDEIFDDFAPQPVDEIKRKKKVAEELLEDFLAPSKKEPAPKKAPPRGKKVEPEKKPSPKESVSEEKAPVEELVDDFIMPPPEEEKAAPPPPPVEEKVKRTPTPPPPPSAPPVSTKPAARKEIVREEKVKVPPEVKGKSFWSPFLMGFASGVVVAGAVAVLFYISTGRKAESKKVVQRPPAAQVEVKKETPSKPEKVASVTPSEQPSPTPPSPPSPPPSPPPQPSSAPPPPPIKFIVTISNIKGDSALRRVKTALSRYGIKETSVASKTVARESYEVYIDKVFTSAEATAADLKLGLMGFKYKKKKEGGGVKFYFGPYSSAGEASGVMQKLIQINYPAKIRVSRTTEKYYTLKTTPISEGTAKKVKRALRRYRVKLEKAS